METLPTKRIVRFEMPRQVDNRYEISDSKSDGVLTLRKSQSCRALLCHHDDSVALRSANVIIRSTHIPQRIVVADRELSRDRITIGAALQPTEVGRAIRFTFQWVIERRSAGMRVASYSLAIFPK